MEDEILNVLELFGGIGACTKAFKRLGVKCNVVDYVEIDKYAVASYNAINGTNFEPQDITKWDKDLDVDFIMHGSPCFVAGTRVITKSGYVNIEDIEIGDEVLTHTNSYNKVVDFGSDGEKPIYELEASGILPVYCTDNHPFYVRIRERHWNNSIRKYEYLLSSPEKVRLSNLDTNKHYIGVPIIPDVKTSLCMLDEDTLWLLGRYVADGYVYNKPRKDRPSNSKCTYICVGSSKVAKFETIAHKFKFSKDENYKGCTKYRFGVDFTNLILKLDLGNGAINKRIPMRILQLPKEKLKIFLNGYMSGDGCNIKHTSVYQATTISRELAESLVLAVQKVYGVGCAIYFTQKPKKCVIENRIVNQRDTYLVRFQLGNNRHQWVADTNCIWYPIKKITNTGTKQIIYNMTVEQDHTYIANNCYVGNCQDISIAGNQAGADESSGTRSSLMYETLRIVEKLKPKYVLWENVKNLISDNHKHNFDTYLDRMEKLGYKNYSDVLNAKDYGVPQNRERVFTLSIRADVTSNAYYFPEKMKLTKRLKDVLEANVDDKYYLSDALIKKIQINSFTQDEKSNNTINKVLDLQNSYEQQGRIYGSSGVSPTIMSNSHNGGYVPPKVVVDDTTFSAKCVQVGQLYGTETEPNPQAGRVYDSAGISPTMDTCSGGNRMPKVIVYDVATPVTVRKYPVDTKKLSDLLISRKKYLKLSNENIATYLMLPVTQVEHYFRGDEYFAIPSPDVWVKLKNYLQIDTDEFDDSIMTFEEKEGVFDSSNRYYGTNGLAPTLDTGDGKKIIEFPVIAASRGRNPDNPSDRTVGAPTEQRLEINTQGTSNTITTVQKDNYVIEQTLDEDRDIYNPLKGISGQSWQFEQNVYSEDSKLVRTIKAGEGSGNIPKIIEDPKINILGNVYNKGQNGNVYDVNGLSPTLSSGETSTKGNGGIGSSNSPKILQRVDMQEEEYNQSRVAMPSFDNINLQSQEDEMEHSQDLAQRDNELCSCTPAEMHKSTPYLSKDGQLLRIRKLTPKECWRLMGFDDDDFDKASKVNSATQLYKQAGNSIVVNVLEAILSNLFETGRKQTKKGIKLW